MGLVKMHSTCNGRERREDRKNERERVFAFTLLTCNPQTTAFVALQADPKRLPRSITPADPSLAPAEKGHAALPAITTIA